MREIDIIDIFIGDCLYVHESASLQFEDIDFGIWESGEWYNLIFLFFYIINFECIDRLKVLIGIQ